MLALYVAISIAASALLPAASGGEATARKQPHVERLQDDSPGIAWDESTLTRISPGYVWQASYPRMIQLHDESLLCVLEVSGSVLASKSSDLGKTWEKPSVIAWRDQERALNMAVPDVLELQDHSILVCYNERPFKISGSRCFGIRTRKSYDGGRTWRQGRLIYEAGHKFGDGCWEPAAIQLPDGEVQVYFANENDFRKTDDQCISMLSSPDGGLTWSGNPTTVSYRPMARDGMPAPLVLRGGLEIVCAIEDLGWQSNFKPVTVRTIVADGWKTPVGPFSENRESALAVPLKRSTYAGAPNLRQLSNGETLLSYQGTEGRRNKMVFADMKVLRGDREGRNFDRLSVPFKVPKDRCALWSSMTVLNDDTVVALTATNAFSRKFEVWMIKGRLVP